MSGRRRRRNSLGTGNEKEVIVTVMGARDLHIHKSALRSHVPDPQVTVALVDRTGAETEVQTTAIVKKTDTPTYDATFTFPIEDPISQVFRVTIHDTGSSHKDDFLGMITVPVSGLMDSRFRSDWHVLQGRTIENEHVQGSLHFTIERDIASNQLIVTVLGGQNLAAKKKNTDPYVVVDVGQDVDTQTTPVIHNETDPEWEGQTFTFDIGDHNIQCVLAVWDWARVKKDTFLGRVVVDIHELEDGVVHQGWFPLEQRDDKKHVSGEILLAFKYNEDTVLGIGFYNEFKRLVTRPPFDVMWALKRCPHTVNDAGDILIDAIFSIFAAEAIHIDLFVALVDRECALMSESAQASSTIFRTNSLTTKIFDRLAHRHFQPWLVSTLGNLVEAIRADPASKDDFDLDAHFETLFGVAETAVVDSLPPLFGSLLAQVAKTIAAWFPTNDTIAFNGVSGLLFLRFVCPAVALPDQKGVVEAQLDAVASRKMLLLAKRLQSVANGNDEGAYNDRIRAVVATVTTSGAPLAEADVPKATRAKASDFHSLYKAVKSEQGDVALLMNCDAAGFVRNHVSLTENLAEMAGDSDNEDEASTSTSPGRGGSGSDAGGEVVMARDLDDATTTRSFREVMEDLAASYTQRMQRRKQVRRPSNVDIYATASPSTRKISGSGYDAATILALKASANATASGEAPAVRTIGSQPSAAPRPKRSTSEPPSRQRAQSNIEAIAALANIMDAGDVAASRRRRPRRLPRPESGAALVSGMSTPPRQEPMGAAIVGGTSTPPRRPPPPKGKASGKRPPRPTPPPSAGSGGGRSDSEFDEDEFLSVPSPSSSPAISPRSSTGSIPRVRSAGVARPPKPKRPPTPTK